MTSINSTLVDVVSRRLLLIGGLAMLVALLVVPRASGQESSTLEFDVALSRESIEVAKALGNPPDPAILARGDVRSAQGVVSAGGERIGTFYMQAVVTFETQHFATAGNHVYMQGFFELFGEGTLSITGVINLTGANTLIITGGTGAYIGAGGQCSMAHSGGVDRWVCELR